MKQTGADRETRLHEIVTSSSRLNGTSKVMGGKGWFPAEEAEDAGQEDGFEALDRRRKVILFWALYAGK
jgi:hypothetical protein